MVLLCAVPERNQGRILHFDDARGQCHSLKFKHLALCLHEQSWLFGLPFVQSWDNGVTMLWKQYFHLQAPTSSCVTNTLQQVLWFVCIAKPVLIMNNWRPIEVKNTVTQQGGRKKKIQTSGSPSLEIIVTGNFILCDLLQLRRFCYHNLSTDLKMIHCHSILQRWQCSQYPWRVLLKEFYTLEAAQCL